MNIEKCHRLFNSFKQFVHGMTIVGKRKKTMKRVPAVKQIGFSGLLITMQSTIGIYEDYFKNSKSVIFYPFQYGQDHLETYFSLMRQSLGSNQNPDIVQFQSAYRKLLYCAPHISVEVDTNRYIEFPAELMLVSSSAARNVNKNKIDINTISTARPNEIEIDYYSINDNQYTQLEQYEQYKYALVASNIEKNIIQRFPKQAATACQDCLNVFSENSKIFDRLVARKVIRDEISAQPCSSTLNLILLSEKINEMIETNEPVHYARVAKTILNNNCLIDSLYESTQFETHQPNRTVLSSQFGFTHKEVFLLDVIRTFFTLKSIQVCKRVAFEEQAEDRKRRLDERAKILARK